jgi:hypothetical protein
MVDNPAVRGPVWGTEIGANAGRMGCIGGIYGTLRTESVGQLGVEALSIWGVVVRGGEWSESRQEADQPPGAFGRDEMAVN